MMRMVLIILGAAVTLSAIPATAQHYPTKLRVPLVQDDTTDPDAAANLKAVAARGIKPHDIHRVYANAPKLQRRSSALAQAIRSDASVPRADRGLIILRAAQNMRGEYQYRQHVPMAISCGMTKAQIDALPRWRESKLFNERQRAVLAYADGMVSAEGVSDAVFEAMTKHFTTKEIVELTMIGAYYGGSARTPALSACSRRRRRTRPGMGGADVEMGTPPVLLRDSAFHSLASAPCSAVVWWCLTHFVASRRYLRSSTLRATSFDR